MRINLLTAVFFPSVLRGIFITVLFFFFNFSLNYSFSGLLLSEGKAEKNENDYKLGNEGKKKKNRRNEGQFAFQDKV